MAVDGCHLHEVDIIDPLGLTLEVQVLSRQLGQHFRKLPDLQQFVAEQGMNVLDHVVEAHGVGQQFVVVFGVGQDRQHADLVHQPAECGLVRFQLGVAAA
ncbi:hypothetical protein D3C80_1889450 [compost metagenome]